jgi:hypothetical protein
MKNILSFEDFINESLEKPYPFREEEEQYDDEDELLTAEYIFNSPTQQYKVVFYSGEYRAEESKFDLSFGLDKGDFNKIDTFEMTGEGNVRTIIKTVATIIEEFLDSWGYDKTVIIDATDEKRRRLYKELFPKYLPAKIMSNNVTIK